jgi:hypothetical protein
MMHCATTRKVAVSTPDGAIKKFIALILPAALCPWCRLSLKQKGVFPEGKGVRLTNLTIFMY